MKRFFCLLLALFLVVGMTACADKKPVFSDFEKDGELLKLTRGDITVTLDPASGMVKAVESSYDSVKMDGILIDPGIDGSQLFNQLGYKDLSGLATYEIPTFYPKMKDLPAYTVSTVAANEKGFSVVLTLDTYTITYNYTVFPSGIGLDAVLSTTGDAVTVNGVGFLVRGIEGYDLSKATYEFPGSTPAGKIAYSASTRYKATASDYCAPAVVLSDGSKSGSVLFVDKVEKWTTGSFFDKDEKPCVGFLAAVEGWLEREKPMEVGTLYIPLEKDGVSSYKTVSDFWTELGYHTPTDTTATKDLVAIYSAHPFGTMDTGYFNRWTLDQYAEKLDAIADMGFDAVWLLPVFSHTGSNVYEPIDQGVIDKRYGGIEAAKVFIDRAHALNMSVLFDFVPHGPRPQYSFAKEHDDWISKDINGNNRIEWECVSMDYNHPDYYAYNQALAKYYASEIGLDGARVDCSMGGLPNWYSAAGLRASAAGLNAGLAVVTALRDGFKEGGADVLMLPENFHPSPAYAPVTDVFYDMPLYRAIYNMKWKNYSETEYVSHLTQYLTAEHESSVAGQLKLRFLGNHDTVTWTFDAARAQKVYGTEKAKAMWKAISWIDGVMFIYQGDEDPATYHLEGENLESFFKELIAIKREYLPNTLDTEYIRTGSPIFGFYRFDDTTTRLVLVNLSESAQTYPLKSGDSVLANMGDYAISGGILTLQPYAGIVLNTTK